MMLKVLKIKCLNFVLWIIVTPLLVFGGDRPNLLIICTDEHNFRTLGCYRELLSEDQAFVWGEGIAVETPHIDSLARDGAICTSFYGTTPLCGPSRASLMTGLYPHATGVPVNDSPLKDGILTFAEVLSRQGYKTGYFGKWHLEGTAKPGWAPERKFGWEDNRYMYNRGHWKNMEDTPNGPRVNTPIGKNGEPTYDLGDADEETYPTDFLTDRTIEFMERNKDEPFCVMLSIPDPHQPDTVRPPYDTMYNHFNFESPRTLFEKNEESPNWIVGNEGDLTNDLLFQEEDMAGYFGMVRLIDDNVGKLLRFLERQELDKNTIVVFLSDHGDLLGEHGRLNKRSPYEGSAISPLIVRYLGKIKEGKVIHSAMTTADFGPTMLSLLKSENSLGDIHGRDVSRQFLSSAKVVTEEEVVYLRGVMGPLGPPPYWLAAIDYRYKLVISKSEPPWLIDLDKDPDELINFYSRQREIALDLSGKLKQLLIKTADTALNDPELMRWLEN
ncbi:MAG: sulfatase [Verrucomicrobia bacterium]|nr:sulfatase [Verrucomicrobiota bacterium]MDA1066152.1 sulfatase [Verrucomicrobiota bacterium]